MFRKAQEAREKQESWTDKLVNKGIPLAGGIAGGIIGAKAGGPQGAMAGVQAGMGAGQTLSGLIGGDEYSKARMTQGVATGLKGARDLEQSMRVGPQAGGEGTKVPTAEPFKAPTPTVSGTSPVIESSRAPVYVSMPNEEQDMFNMQFGQGFGKVDPRLRLK